MLFNFKKISAIALSAMLALSVTACGKDAPEAEQTVSETTAVTEAPEAVSARITVDGTKFMVNGKEWWSNGVNTPWHKWNDFSGQMDEEHWDKTFALLAENNINSTRIWVNCNGESIVRLKSTGEPQAVNDAHWTDLDKLFALAEKHQVYIMATLTSFDHFKEPNGGYDQWRTLLQTKEYTDLYAEMYVKEFCTRYGANEYLFSIDIMNEPDWVTENAECGKIGLEHLAYFFGKCAATIHENCDTLVTVGMGMPKYNSDKYSGNHLTDEFLKEITGNENAYLDFYSPHYYGWMKATYGMPFDQTPTDYGMDGTKPCVVGETPNDDESTLGISVTDKYLKSHENGWNGVMVWMEPRDDEETGWYRFDLTAAATNKMAETIPDKIYPNGNEN